MDVYSANEVIQARNNVVRRFSLLRERLGSRVLASRGLQTQLQAVYGLKLHDPLENKIAKIILDHAALAERTSPGAFLPCIDAIVGHTSNDDVNEIVAAGARVPTLQDVQNVVNDLRADQPDWLAALIFEALTLAGHGGRIFVERAVSICPSVERVVGHTFKLEPGFRANCRLAKPRVLLIDGFVESVAELDRVLQAANEDLDPALVFFRGAHPEVFNTLKVNFDRGSLRIVPFVVQLDLDGINQLRDIATIASADVVSADKGQLINLVDFRSLPRIVSATVKNDCVVLSNPRAAAAVAMLVAELRVRRAKSHETLQKVYDERIRALTGNHVVIRLPDDKSYVAHAQFVDYVLRAIRSLVDHGASPTAGFGCSRLVATRVAAALYAEKCSSVLQDIGAVVA